MNFIELLNTRLTELNEERARRIGELEAITTAAERDNRSALTDTETQVFNEVRSRIESIDDELNSVRSRLADLNETQARRDAVAAAGIVEGPARRHDGTAHGIVDAAFRSGRLPDHAAERVTELLRDDDPTTRSVANQWATLAGDDSYLSAFSKLVIDPQRGHMLWNDSERRAFAAMHQFAGQLEGRALSTSSLTLPLVLDPAIRLTSAGSINPLRQIATVHTTTSDSWNGLTSAGVTAEWKAEGAQMSDASPTIATETIPVELGEAFVPFSFEVGMDALEFTTELSKLLVDAADQLQATAFTTGSGANNQPTGVITALTAGGATSVVTPTTAETFAAADVYKVQNALPARFQPNAAWCAALGTVNTMAQFQTNNGAKEFPELGDGRLLRRPLHELSNMRSALDINPAATEANPILLYGDFAQGFAIVDRIGTQLEIIPHLFGANQRPTAQRGAVMWFRTGSDVVVQNAFRLLNVATTE